MAHFRWHETVHRRSLRCVSVVIVNRHQRCVRLIAKAFQVKDEMSAYETGGEPTALKIGAAVTVLAAEILAALALLLVTLG